MLPPAQQAEGSLTAASVASTSPGLGAASVGSCAGQDGLMSSGAPRAEGGEGPSARKFETEDFHWTTQGISHPKRRRQILAKYPDVELLSGYDLRAGVYSILVTLLNIYLGYKVSVWRLSWYWVLLMTYVVSATLNHVLFLSMHESAHCSLFPGRRIHEFYVVFSNLSMGVPAGMGFLRYHLDHHVWMGTDGMDPDIPSELEARLFRSRFGKVLFVLLLPLTYSLRPMLRNPKPVIPMEVFNWCVVLLWDVAVWYYWGFRSLFYFVGGTFLSLSIHPLNGHLIAEHYQFPRGQSLQETWSTYGIENYITYCVGYHVEHHDFPRIPGYRLPQLRAMAPEFYSLPHHTSWLECILQFIWDSRVSPFSRVKRVSPRGGAVPPPHKPMLKEPEELGSYWIGPTEETETEGHGDNQETTPIADHEETLNTRDCEETTHTEGPTNFCKQKTA